MLLRGFYPEEKNGQLVLEDHKTEYNRIIRVEFKKSFQVRERH